VTAFWWLIPWLVPFYEPYLGYLWTQPVFPALHTPGTLTFLLGLLLSRFCSVNIDRYPWHYVGQVFYGGATLITHKLTANVKIGEFNKFLDYGTLITTVAGLLNIVVMVDFFETWARKR